MARMFFNPKIMVGRRQIQPNKGTKMLKAAEKLKPVKPCANVLEVTWKSSIFAT